MNKKTLSAQPVQPATSTARHWRRFLPLGLTCSLPQLLRAENHVDYRYGYYDETGDRMKIETHSVYFEQKLIDSVTAKGELTYDGVSGATPRGTHNWVDDGSGNGTLKADAIKKDHMWDLRRAESLELDCRLYNHTLTPGYSHSEEHDYKSDGISLNDSIEFNDKNTILQLGLSHNFDSVSKTGSDVWHEKNSTEGIIGISQLLTPKDIFNVAFTFGNDSGYLNDAYRKAEAYDSGAGFGVAIDEVRPAHRNKEVLFTSLTHHFNSLDASLEASYRYYHDSYGVSSHTAGLAWHQWLGKHFIFEPFARFGYQTAASFYSPLLTDTLPTFYSSDYRLSELNTTDIGVQFTAVITDHLRAVAGYHRYEMNGLDHVTSPEMYPKANVFSVGLSILW